MALPNIYSRRKKIESATHTDVFIYDKIPQNVRIQIIQIVEAGIGKIKDNYYEFTESYNCYSEIVSMLREEIGTYSLSNVKTNDPLTELKRWVLEEQNIDFIIDFIEISLIAIDQHVRDNEYKFEGITKNADQCINEINARLLEAEIGYQYKNSQIIRIDSELIHKEIVIPALILISDPKFESVNREYISAHSHYRHGDYEACLIECAKSFESTLKIIGSDLRWKISENDTSSKLIAAAVEAKFLSAYFEAGFTSLRSLLESGIPAPRNKQAGHGAGMQKRFVHAELAAYQLHQTAAAIVFLIESYRRQSPTV